MNFKVLSVFLAVCAMLPPAMSQTAGQPTCAMLNPPNCITAPECRTAQCQAGSTCCDGDFFGRKTVCCAKNTDLLTTTTTSTTTVPPPGSCKYEKNISCFGTTKIGCNPFLGIDCAPGYTCCPETIVGTLGAYCCINNVNLGITTTATVPAKVTTTSQTNPTTAVINPTTTGSVSCSKLNKIDCTFDFERNGRCDSTNPCDTGYTCCGSGVFNILGMELQCCVSNTDYLTPSTVFPPAECANLISRDCSSGPGFNGQCNIQSCGAGYTCCPASSASGIAELFTGGLRCCVNNTNVNMNPPTGAPPGSCNYVNNISCITNTGKLCSLDFDIPCDPGYTCCPENYGTHGLSCCINNVNLGVTTTATG